MDRVAELHWLGSRIRSAREHRGLTVEALAEASSLSVRGLLYIEHGRRNPSYLTLVAISAGLGLSVAELTRKSD